MRFFSQKLDKLSVFIVFALAVFTISCNAQTEEQALQMLREMTKDGKLPAESVVAPIESRFANKKTGALAKLLRARIKFESGDYNGAAELLNSNIFKDKTLVADYAGWLRASAFMKAGNYAAAMQTADDFLKNYPNSMRARDVKLFWAEAATKSGRANQVLPFLKDLNDKYDGDALIATAQAFESAGDAVNATQYYRLAYFRAAGSNAAKTAETKLLAAAAPTPSPTPLVATTTIVTPTTPLKLEIQPKSADEMLARAEKLFTAGIFAEAQKAFDKLAMQYPQSLNAAVNLKRLKTASSLKRMPDAQVAFNQIPQTAAEKEEAAYTLAVGYAKARMFADARRAVDDIRRNFPNGKLAPKAFVDAGLAAREAKNRVEENYFLQSALSLFPNAVNVAQAQFENSWSQHEQNQFGVSSQMLTEHLARYADKDSTNRGKAGYWAARDSERAGKFAEACALYDAMLYRYGANWYGHLSMQRLTPLRTAGSCGNTSFDKNSVVGKAVANLKTVSAAPENAGAKELERAAKSEELAVIGLFDWSIDELKEAQKTAPTSPKINLSLARHYRWKGDNAAALLALAKSYPDYSQMFPEEMSREEWDIFYPLAYWSDIKKWSAARDLDPYQVAGFIRQETIFSARAKSGANAYGLMQLLIPTARSVAKKYNASTTSISAETLFNPAINIELGTAYIRDQYDKFFRTEFVAVAYNAGPGRVGQWRASLPAEMDEFVENIPFKETKGYVQGIIRNSAQYRRLYDDNGNWKPNVGTRPIRAELDTKSTDQLAQDLPEITVMQNANGADD